MKKLLTLTLLLITTVCFSQKNVGIQFVNQLSWEQIKAEAKAENKYIFLDIFTTWCGPCKAMAANVFPLTEVGDFYNNNFISAKVQMDTSKKDDAETIAWRQDAKLIGTMYPTKSFPTYLFLNPDGELVHKVIGGSSADVFIARGRAALNTDKQYYTLKRQYENGRRDTAFVSDLFNATVDAFDDNFIPIISNEYLSTQTDFSKPTIIRVLPFITHKTDDRGFSFLLNNQATVDSVFGKGASLNFVKGVLTNEYITPYLRTGETKHIKSMAIQTGNYKKDVNWTGIQEKLDAKYPQFTKELLLKAKADFYVGQKDYSKFAIAFSEYYSSYPSNVNKEELNNYAWMLFQSSDDINALKSALVWSKKTLEGESAKEVMFLYTYANLLYKTGKKAEAIKVESEAVKLSGEKEEDGELHKVLKRMRKGEKTW